MGASWLFTLHRRKQKVTHVYLKNWFGHRRELIFQSVDAELVERGYSNSNIFCMVSSVGIVVFYVVTVKSCVQTKLFSPRDSVNFSGVHKRQLLKIAR